MSRGRPTKAERDAWAELLGDEGRSARRIRVRIAAIAFLAIVVAAGVWGGGAVARLAGGSCRDATELRDFWAKPKAATSQADRDAAIEETIRCVDLTGKTRDQLQVSLGDWTTVSEYRPKAVGGRASFLVWSNGNRSDGVRVDFRSNGIARSASEYRPEGTTGSSGDGATVD